MNNFRRSTINSFLENGYQVSAVCPENTGEDLLRDLGVELKTFPLSLAGTNPFEEIRSIRSLLWLLRDLRPDVVFSFNPKTNLYSLLVCRVLSIPCIPNVSGVGNASQLPGWKGCVYRCMQGIAFRKAATIFFQNSTDQKAFSDSGILKSVPHECLRGSGVDLKRFRPTVRASDSPVRFLLACRLIRQKGVVEYLRAAEALKNIYGSRVEFLLAGVSDHSARAVSESEIMDFANKGVIDYLGNVPDISVVMDKVDCVVLPSVYPEGVPRFLLEGAAAGKIIVTTDRPGCQDTMTNGVNGYFCEPKSVASLRAVMEKVLLLSSESLRSMGEESRKLAVAYFDEQLVIGAYLKAAERFAKN